MGGGRLARDDGDMAREHGSNDERALRGDASEGCWGSVGYAGRPFAPAQGTYQVLAAGLRWTSRADSGDAPEGRSLANLHPLVAAALFESGFAFEAGPLSTWSN